MRVSLEADPTPLVAATANDLEACMADPAFAAAAERVRGLVSLRAAATPQAVTLRLADDGISVARGFSPDADVRVTLGDDHTGAATELEGRDANPDLSDWVDRLLDPPEPGWEEAAERFWSAVSAMPGAPSGLLVVDLDSGDERGFGAGAGAYEIHGSAAELLAVLAGHIPLIEAAYEGRVFIRGSFPQLSVLCGAGFEIRYGRGAGSG